MIAIYCIRNTITNEPYVGATTNISDRWGNHRRDLMNPNKSHDNYLLQESCDKYGIDAFDFYILEEIIAEPIQNYNPDWIVTVIPEVSKLNPLQIHKQILDAKETFWISKLDSKKHGFNLTDGGCGLVSPPQAVRDKISEANRGSNNHFYGVHLCGELNPHFGKRQSEESRRKISEKAKLRTGENNCRSKKVQPFWNSGNNVVYGEIFVSSKDASKWSGCDNSSIGKCAKGQLKYAGKHPITGEKLSWRYV